MNVVSQGDDRGPVQVARILSSRDWARWRLDGWEAVKPRRKEGEYGEGPSLAITAMFFF